MTALRSSINQQVQLGLETPGAFGTPVPANKLIEAWEWTLGMKPDTKQFRATGRRYATASEELTEMAEGKVKGQGCYNSLSYLLAGLYGLPTTTLHTGAAASYDQVWTPPIQGAQSPQALTIQQGDANYAEQYAYGLVTGFSYEVSRKAEIAVTGDLMMQQETDAALTAAPTPIPTVPMVGKHFNLYLDATSAGIGGTQIVNPIKFGPTASGYYAPFWPVNRANASWSQQVDTEPKFDFKLLLEADTQGKSLRTYLQNGTRCYVRVGAQGPLSDNDWAVGVGAASAGTFTLTFKGQTTAGIAYNATAAAVKSAIQALSTVGAGNVNVTGTAPTWTVQFTGALALDTSALTGSGSGLTGGAFTATAAPVYYTFTHDMCFFVTNVADFSDSDGVYAIEWTFGLAEDTGWNTGQAQKITLTNTLSAL